MQTLVLTVIGDDRAGLVRALADTVAAHGGNWERSQLAELAGKFAGIVEISVDDARVEALREALRPLSGLLDVTVHAGRPDPAEAVPGTELRLELLGNDHPGIVRSVTEVLARQGLSVEEMTTETRDAPMAGGRLFEATIVATARPDADLTALRADLEQLATELQVDLSVDPV